MSDQFTFDDNEAVIRLRCAWDQVLKSLSQDVPKSTYNKFLKPLTPVNYDDGWVEMEAPGAFVAEWVKNKYLGRLEQLLHEELGEPIHIELEVVGRERAPVDTVMSSPIMEAPILTDHTVFKPVAKYRFDQFVVGQSNRMAFAGAKAVAGAPGQKYNPLFIYGSSGLGKTHLLHSIAHEVLARDPRTNIAYITAQQFAEQFVQALQNNRIDQFRRAQRGVGIWLVDDIQLIANKDKTQEEIFHTFNSLHQTGKQIVICADRAPRELYLMDERLRSRFESGLVVDILAPDTETRAAILLSKAAAENVPLDTEVALHLAENVPGNVRILEGALAKLVVLNSIENQPISVEMAESIIEKYYRNLAYAKPGVDQIVSAVGKYFKIPVDDIRGASRKAPIIVARHVAVYITREITGDSWKHIGNQFGDRDHTSMMHAYQKISQEMARDKDFSSTVKSLIRNLYPNG
ncbi:MAG: chromosomal replication initiator protein DnaA [Armatimonadetes bacterium]|nr:chromosomal replication initiator protein DnaA [Armatimonadota bacterium]